MRGIKAVETLRVFWVPQRIFGEAITLPGEKPLRKWEMNQGGLVSPCKRCVFLGLSISCMLRAQKFRTTCGMFPVQKNYRKVKN